MDKLSYALGMSMGHNFKGTGIKTLNSADFAAGVASVYDGVKPEMTFDEAKRIVNEYFAKLEAEMQAEAAKQGEVNRKNGEAFLTENAKREGIKVTESGLQYEVLESGKGDSPKASDNVEVHYTGKLIDGIIGIGSGGNYAMAAAKALYDVEGLSAEDIARKALNIAGDIDVYTNHNLIIERVAADE